MRGELNLNRLTFHCTIGVKFSKGKSNLMRFRMDFHDLVSTNLYQLDSAIYVRSGAKSDLVDWCLLARDQNNLQSNLPDLFIRAT